MNSSRIFLGSSGKQAEAAQVAHQRPATSRMSSPGPTSFNPGTTTLERLIELTREVDFAAFVFAQDDWTTPTRRPGRRPGQASPRDNVVFEAGLFGGVLGMRRTFILHANGAKLPTDLLGLTASLRRRASRPSSRRSTRSSGRRSRPRAAWPASRALVAFSLTARTEDEPSAISLLGLARPDGALALAGRSWQETAPCRRATGARRRGAVRAGRDLLLLERRAAPPPGRAAVRRHRRDQDRVRRPRGRLLDHPLGRRPELNARTSGSTCAPTRRLAVLDGPDVAETRSAHHRAAARLGKPCAPTAKRTRPHRARPAPSG